MRSEEADLECFLGLFWNAKERIVDARAAKGSSVSHFRPIPSISDVRCARRKHFHYYRMSSSCDYWAVQGFKGNELVQAELSEE